MFGAGRVTLKDVNRQRNTSSTIHTLQPYQLIYCFLLLLSVSSPILRDMVMETTSRASISTPLMAPLGIRKVLSNRSRTSIQDAGNETNTALDLRKSADSIREHSPKDLSRKSSRDEESSKSGSSGVRKLIPGHAKRKRRRQREAAGLFQAGSESADSNPSLNTSSAIPPNAPGRVGTNDSPTSLLQDDNSSLMTEDEPEPSS